jgi:hypothetical protein
MENKKQPQPTRSTIPQDEYGHHKPYQRGTMPVGGFQAIWNNFGGVAGGNKSATSGGGKKVY